MPHEALYSGVLSLSPAVLIAFVLEWRGLFRDPKDQTNLAKGLYLVGITTSFMAIVIALAEVSAIPVSEQKGQAGTAQFLVIIVLVSLSALFGLLMASISSKKTDND